MSINSFNLSRLRSAIKPFRLHWVSRVGSTNDYATMLRKRGELFAPAIVLTGHQTRGRGRNSNTWWSGEGSLTVTFVLPIDEQLLPHQLPLIAGLAVRNAAAEVSGNDAIQLKWPNDLLYRDRKLAGLLCERVHKADLIGLGMNINQESGLPRSLRQRVVWLSQIAGRPIDKAELLIAVVKHLHPMLTRRAHQPFAHVLREYDRHHALLGRHVSITPGESEPQISGTCQGLDSMGRLLVRQRNGTPQRVIAGQVEMK
jgi:BirA family biotin operon repressor/biotin-[acetyl-CoA-carboxylase] ligase